MLILTVLLFLLLDVRKLFKKTGCTFNDYFSLKFENVWQFIKKLNNLFSLAVDITSFVKATLSVATY